MRVVGRDDEGGRNTVPRSDRLQLTCSSRIPALRPVAHDDGRGNPIRRITVPLSSRFHSGSRGSC